MSTHRTHAEQAVTARFGLERGGAMAKAVAWHQNIYPGVHEAQSALYAQPPRVKGPSEVTAKAVAKSRHWVRMQRTQRDVSALREMFVLIESEGGNLILRTIYPDLFEGVRPLNSDPNTVGAISLWVEYGEDGWERRDYDLDAEGGPLFAMYRTTGEGGALVEVESERRQGANYPWRRDGVAHIPGVMYHAAETGWILDWETGTDVAHGAVSVMVDYTNAAHGHAEASWLQRVAIDMEITGVEVREIGGTAEAQPREVAVADPSVLLRGTSEEGKQGSVQTLSAPADPEALLRYAMAQARNVYSAAGIRTPEVTKQASDIRSGYSLAVANEALAALQVQFKQVFGAADRELLHKAAIELNEPSTGPEDWTVRYRLLRAPAAELQQRVATATAATAAGLMTRLEAMLTLYPDMTEEEAQETLDEIDAEVARRPPADAPPKTGAIP